MSITESEQALNRHRLLLVAEKCGFDPHDLAIIEHIAAKYPNPPGSELSLGLAPVEVQHNSGLVLGDGCLRDTMPPSRGMDHLRA